MIGRPRAITEAIIERLCLAIAGGSTIRQACAEDGMPAASTVYLELARNAAFSEQYARAREAQLTRWEDEILEIADDGTNDWTERQISADDTIRVVDHEHIARSKLRTDTRKWIMSKRLPAKYGDRLELSGEVTTRYTLDDKLPTAAEWEAEHAKPESRTEH